MEKNEKKKFNLVNFIWIIPLVIGIIVGLNGISKINAANNIYVPPMGNEGWFDAKTAKSNAEFSGIAMCTIGFFVIGIMGTIMCYAIPKAIKASKKHIKAIDSYATSKAFSTEPSVQKTPTEKLKECLYCGSLVASDVTECDSCGGKKFKKHKH